MKNDNRSIDEKEIIDSLSMSLGCFLFESIRVWKWGESCKDEILLSHGILTDIGLNKFYLKYNPLTCHLIKNKGSIMYETFPVCVVCQHHSVSEIGFSRWDQDPELFTIWDCQCNIQTAARARFRTSLSDRIDPGF